MMVRLAVLGFFLMESGIHIIPCILLRLSPLGDLVLSITLILIIFSCLYTRSIPYLNGM